MSSDAICVGTQVKITGLQKRPEMNGIAGTCVEYDQTEQRWYVEVLTGESVKRFRLKIDNLIVTAPASVNEVTQPAAAAAPAATTNQHPASTQSQPTTGTGGPAKLPGTEPATAPQPASHSNTTGPAAGAAASAGPVQSPPKAVPNVAPATNVATTAKAATAPTVPTATATVAASATAPVNQPPAQSEQSYLRAGGRARICGLKSRADLNGMECKFIDFDQARGRWRVDVIDQKGEVIERSCIRPQNAVALEATADASTETGTPTRGQKRARDAKKPAKFLGEMPEVVSMISSDEDNPEEPNLVVCTNPRSVHQMLQLQRVHHLGLHT